MSVSSIASGANSAELTRQLKVEQKTLADDQRKQASQSVIDADKARVVAAQKAVAAAPTSADASLSKPAGDGEVDAYA